MAYRADEIKVGLVIVVSLLILAGFIISNNFPQDCYINGRRQRRIFDSVMNLKKFMEWC